MSASDSERDIRALSEFLIDRDWPCPSCNYNLRGLTSSVCPECGTRLTLQVGQVTPRFGLFLLLLSPLFTMVGIGCVFGLLALIVGLPDAWGFYAIESTALVDVLALKILYRKRRLVLRTSRRSQLLLASGAWLFHAAVLVLSITVWI